MMLFPGIVSISKDGIGESCRSKQKYRAVLVSTFLIKVDLEHESELKWGEEKAQKQ